MRPSEFEPGTATCQLVWLPICHAISQPDYQPVNVSGSDATKNSPWPLVDKIFRGRFRDRSSIRFCSPIQVTIVSARPAIVLLASPEVFFLYQQQQWYWYCAFYKRRYTQFISMRSIIDKLCSIDDSAGCPMGQRANNIPLTVTLALCPHSQSSETWQF